MKKAQKLWKEVTTGKIRKSEAKELYNELIQKDIDALEREKSNSIKKHNILNILNNVGLKFTGVYLYYKDVPKEIMFQRSVVERSKSRSERLSVIKKRTEDKQWIV